MKLEIERKPGPIVISLTLDTPEEVKAVRALAGGVHTGDIRAAISRSLFPDAEVRLAYQFLIKLVALEKYL